MPPGDREGGQYDDIRAGRHAWSLLITPTVFWRGIRIYISEYGLRDTPLVFLYLFVWRGNIPNNEGIKQDLLLYIQGRQLPEINITLFVWRVCIVRNRLSAFC